MTSESKVPTGAELRARREALGLSEEWAREWTEANRRAHDIVSLSGVERECWDIALPSSPARRLRAAYAAALDAEEARRANAEPVPPEGVTVAIVNRKREVKLNGVLCFCVDTWGVCDCHTDVVPVMSGQHWPASLVRYAADLAEWCAHAAGEKQRKLDAVRAAEKAYEAACAEESRTYHALHAAKREAGL